MTIEGPSVFLLGIIITALFRSVNPARSRRLDSTAKVAVQLEADSNRMDRMNRIKAMLKEGC
jgi:hypothetical protein